MLKQGSCLGGAASTLMLREGVGAGCPKCTMVCSAAAAANAAAAAINATGSSASSATGGITSPFRTAVAGGSGGSSEFTLADTLGDNNDTASISSGVFERVRKGF